jgi:hypothetical protein
VYGIENWTTGKADQKYLESFKIRCWRMEISWTDCVRNENILQTVKKERNVLHTIKKDG